jgi:prolyl oligopeptidase
MSLHQIPSIRLITGAAVLAFELLRGMSAEAAPASEDLAWLEQAQGERALKWARAETARSVRELTQDPNHQQYYKAALAIAQDKNRIPAATALEGWLYDGWVYNRWIDSSHPRGLLRRARVDSYESANPVWQAVLDVDALARREGRQWELSQLDCAPPRHRRCMIGLSDGGQDALVHREYDVEDRAFVRDGFVLEESVQGTTVAWRDEDTLLVATHFGPDTQTNAGFPRLAKEWRRHTRLETATELYKGDPSSLLVSVQAYVGRSGRHLTTVQEMDNEGRTVILVSEDGKLERLTLPSRFGSIALAADHWIVSVGEDWTSGGRTWRAGSLIAIPVAEAVKKNPAIHLLAEPRPIQSVFYVYAVRDGVLAFNFVNAVGRLAHFRYESGRWRPGDVVLPDNGIVNVAMLPDIHSRTAYVRYEAFLQPLTLYKLDLATDRAAVMKRLPDQFRSDQLATEQLEAISADGTRVPYFIVKPNKLPLDGQTPTLMYGYGAHGMSQHPSYSGVLGKLWLENGGVYVVANIRGGGEFGESWHRAATRANKNRSYEDFAAVARDLFRRKITAPPHLGIRGMSSGGLLMGVMLTQYPELFNAVIAEVPVLDLFRGDLMQGGRDGTAIEYGSPDVAAERAVLERTSPYQNLSRRPGMPVPLIITSTKDDRVHPAQARRFAAKMQALDLPFFYYESAEGGHDGTSDPQEHARLDALIYTYLAQRLMK